MHVQPFMLYECLLLSLSNQQTVWATRTSKHQKVKVQETLYSRPRTGNKSGPWPWSLYYRQRCRGGGGKVGVNSWGSGIHRQWGQWQKAACDPQNFQKVWLVYGNKAHFKGQVPWSVLPVSSLAPHTTTQIKAAPAWNMKGKSPIPPIPTGKCSFYV